MKTQVVGRIRPGRPADGGADGGGPKTEFRVCGDLRTVQLQEVRECPPTTGERMPNVRAALLVQRARACPLYSLQPMDCPRDQGDWIGRPVRLDKVYTDSITRRQFFRESVYPLVDGLGRGQSSTVVLIGGRHAGKWDAVLGAKHERRGPASLSSRQSIDGPHQRPSMLAPNFSPGSGGSPGRRFESDPADIAGVQAASTCSGGLISMILDMVYEHARQVGCASHRFRLSCSACEVGEHPDANIVDILEGESSGRGAGRSKGPTLLVRRDTCGGVPRVDRVLPRVDSDPDLGATVKGLEDLVEEFKSPFSSGRLKELVLEKLVQQRERSGDAAKHYMLSLVLEQSKRPTFQAHDAPKGRNTDRSHFLGLQPFRRAKFNLIVAGEVDSRDGGGGRGWRGALEHLACAANENAGLVPCHSCNFTQLIRESLTGHHSGLVSS